MPLSGCGQGINITKGRNVNIMLTAKENMRETIRGGNPDRFVNQYEAVQLLFHSYLPIQTLFVKGQMNVVNAWGIINSSRKMYRCLPVHTPDKIL